MTADKVREVLNVYKKKLDEMGVPKERFSRDLIPTSRKEFLAHCRAMLDEMETLIQQGRMDKVFRWLGFVQGCLWSAGCYDLESLKNHNRPDPPDFRGHE